MSRSEMSVLQPEWQSEAGLPIIYPQETHTEPKKLSSIPVQIGVSSEQVSQEPNIKGVLEPESDTDALSLLQQQTQTQTPAARHLQRRLHQIISASHFDTLLNLQETLTLHSVSSLAPGRGKTIGSFIVSPSHTNRRRHLHGSCCAAILEAGCLTAMAAAARPEFWATLGVARSVRVVYLTSAKEGDKCVIESEVIKAGLRMCLIRSSIRRLSDGEIIATCECERANVDKDMPNL